MSDEFIVVPDLSEDIIIGATTIRKWRIKLDFEHNTIVVSSKEFMLKELKLID